MALSPAGLLSRLSKDLTSALGDNLLGLSVHGSYVAGDYHPGRSDLDLLAILAHDPTEATLTALAAVHDHLVRDHPDWVDHVEVDYVSQVAVGDVLVGGPAHAMTRISPGEPLHLTGATSHYLLNWDSAQQHGEVLVGSSAKELLPPFPPEHILQIVLDHLQQWPEWVKDARRPGTQAYAVLTVCRGAATVNTGRRVSKRAGAAYELVQLPEWAPLIEWARDWWYAEGRDEGPDRLPEVSRFVREVTSPLLTDHGRGPLISRGP